MNIKIINFPDSFYCYYSSNKSLTFIISLYKLQSTSIQLMKKSAYTAIITLLLLAYLAQSQYRTTPTRTESVTSLCADFPSRQQIVSQEAIDQNEQYEEILNTQFGGLSGKDIIMGPLNNDLSTLTNPDFISRVSIFVGAFLIALIVLLIMFCFLCCCCVCPSCCPSSCCRKPEGQAYTKCELYWPAITLICAFLVIMIGGILGVSEAGDLEKSMQASGCAISILIDDMINGNVTTDETAYFLGVKTLDNELQIISNNIPKIGSQLSRVETSNDPSSLYSNLATLKTDIGNIPPGGTTAVFTDYTTPFFTAGVAGTKASDFPAKLGSSSDPGSDIDIAIQNINVIETALKLITDDIETFASSITSFQSAISPLQDSIGEITLALEDTDSSFIGIFDLMNPILEIITTVLIAFFAVVLSFSVIGIVMTILITFCKFYKCRYFIYFICVIFFFVSIVCLLVAFIMSLLTPLVYFGCDFLKSSLSPQGFSDNFGDLVGQQTTNYLTVCLPGGNGKILDQIGGSAVDDLDELSDIIDEMRIFDGAAFIQQLDNAWNPLSNVVKDYSSGALLDFSDASLQAELNLLADSTNARYSACNANFKGDSWIPTSTRPSLTISCTVGGGAATSTDCPNLGTYGTDPSCNGCMSTQDILNAEGGTGSISGRYGCAQFTTDIGSAWTNFFSVKKTNYFDSGIVSRTTTIQTTGGILQNTKTSITGLETTFNDVLDQLEATVSSITDKQYGLFAGLNCLIFGEDLQLMINTFCAYFFNTVYLLRISTGMVGITIMFSMCCTVCTGVRHYKQSLIPENQLNNETADKGGFNNTEEGLYGNKNAFSYK